MEISQIALARKYSLTLGPVRGQHLLIDPNIQRKIVKIVHPKPKERILEIGPGLGALTAGMLEAGARVIAVEKDRRFCEILEEELGQDYKGKLWIKNADILKTELSKLWKSAGTAAPGRPKGLKVVSNLPYCITSPILFWLIENRTFIRKVILMMQREVADRLLAQPGDKNYGRLTLGVRYYAEVQRAFHVSRNCFTPRPEVDSTVLTLDFRPASERPRGLDEKFLFHVIQTAFGERRKTLLNRLARDVTVGRPRAGLVTLLNRLGISETARAEDLLLKDFVRLAGSLQVKIKGV